MLDNTAERATVAFAVDGETMLEPAQLELFRDSLLSGRYNLLLGSGTSLTSRNKLGQLLRSAERLRQELCTLTGSNANTSLTRAYGLLTDDQRRSEIVEKYSGCKPGADLNPLARYIWKRLFT